MVRFPVPEGSGPVPGSKFLEPVTGRSGSRFQVRNRTARTGPDRWIESRVERGFCSSSLPFYRDLLLLFNNALVFHPKSSVESLAALDLLRLVSSHFWKTPGAGACDCGKLGELRRVFDCFDQKGDGRISPAELSTCVRSLGGDLSCEDAEMAMRASDLDEDEMLGFEEFQSLVGGGGEEERRKDLEEAFGMYDMDGSGCITASGLKRMLSRLGEKRSVEDCKALISPASHSLSHSQISSSTPERFDPLLPKHKSSSATAPAPIIVCRKRSSISAQQPVNSGKKPALDSKPAHEQGLIKMNAATKERTRATNAKGRPNKNPSGLHSTIASPSIICRSGPVPGSGKWGTGTTGPVPGS